MAVNYTGFTTIPSVSGTNMINNACITTGTSMAATQYITNNNLRWTNSGGTYYQAVKNNLTFSDPLKSGDMFSLPYMSCVEQDNILCSGKYASSDGFNQIKMFLTKNTTNQLSLWFNFCINKEEPALQYSSIDNTLFCHDAIIQEKFKKLKDKGILVSDIHSKIREAVVLDNKKKEEAEKEQKRAFEEAKRLADLASAQQTAVTGYPFTYSNHTYTSNSMLTTSGGTTMPAVWIANTWIANTGPNIGNYSLSVKDQEDLYYFRLNDMPFLELSSDKFFIFGGDSITNEQIELLYSFRLKDFLHSFASNERIEDHPFVFQDVTAYEEVRTTVVNTIYSNLIEQGSQIFRDLNMDRCLSMLILSQLQSYSKFVF